MLINKNSQVWLTTYN